MLFSTAILILQDVYGSPNMAKCSRVWPNCVRDDLCHRKNLVAKLGYINLDCYGMGWVKNTMFELKVSSTVTSTLKLLTVWCLLIV